MLAISDGLHDVHSLGKEAVAMHSTLMESISKVKFQMNHISVVSLLFFLKKLSVTRYFIILFFQFLNSHQLYFFLFVHQKTSKHF